jgi:hypothetical protein
MNKQPELQERFVISYLSLRKAIGILGISLPIVVSLGAWLLARTGLQSSLSGYYYTVTRDVFVGMLWAIGIFLLSYKGYDRVDDIVANLSCAFALGVALLPTAPDNGASALAEKISYGHLIFAALFFGALVYFCLFQFTKSDQKTPSKRKLQRNKVYKTCGIVMAVCIILIGLVAFFPAKQTLFLAGYRPIFWLEAFAIEAFGVSWFVKGEAILKD